jgi:hypothetical protein
LGTITSSHSFVFFICTNIDGGGTIMDNYKPNSKVSKKVDDKGEIKKEKVEKIVKGTVKSKKKNGFFGSFLSGDFMDIKEYIMQDVLVPALKNAIEDAITNGISMMLNGGEPRRRGDRKSSASRVSYRSYYDRDDRDRDRGRSSKNTGYSYDDIILETRGEAEDVINRLDELIDVYGMASVADLYDLVGISGQYTDNKYGWTDVRNATHVRVRDGYLLKMPRAIALN